MFSVNLLSSVFVDKLMAQIGSGLFLLMIVLVLGYLLGKISIKGVSFGSSGVFIVALIAGIILYKWGDKIGFAKFLEIKDASTNKMEGQSFLDTVKNLGLVLFVTSIGLIAGPTFFRNFKKKALAYVTIGTVITLVAGILCVGFLMIQIGGSDDKPKTVATFLGLLMGALSSTPGLTAALSVVDPALEGAVSAASGLAYPFGVLGVVFFVQIVPKIMRADMNKELEKMRAALSGSKSVDSTAATENALIKAPEKPLIKLDGFGYCVFFIAAALGILLGAITIPFSASALFSLGTTGGALIVGLLFGHFKRVGRISLEVPTNVLKTLRELGLVLFLAGSGIEGGLKFLEVATVMFFLYGVIMTIVPMVIGFIVARFCFKLELLNNLGAICGGMTSTPALGSLIHVAKTDDVGQAYAATYPISLLLLVFLPQIIYMLPIT